VGLALTGGNVDAPVFSEALSRWRQCRAPSLA
jgi:hypothetical protein